MTYPHPSELTAHLDARSVALFVIVMFAVIAISAWRGMKDEDKDDK